MLILGLIIGFIAGTFTGVMAMSFCFVAKTNDEYTKKYSADLECEQNDTTGSN